MYEKSGNEYFWRQRYVNVGRAFNIAAFSTTWMTCKKWNYFLQILKTFLRTHVDFKYEFLKSFQASKKELT